MSQYCTNCLLAEKFSFLSTEDFEKIHQNCLLVKFKKNENICKQNLNLTHTLYLVNGLALISAEAFNKTSVLDIITKNNFLGIQSMFGKARCSFSITAIEPIQVCMIESSLFKELIQKNNFLLVEITKQLSNTVFNLYQRINNLSHKSIKSKLASTIIYLSEIIYQNEEFTVSLSRKDFADFIGASRENTVKALTQLKKDGIIDIKGKIIKIIKKLNLNSIALNEITE